MAKKTITTELKNVPLTITSTRFYLASDPIARFRVTTMESSEVITINMN